MVLCRITLLLIFAVIIRVHSQLDPNGFLSIDCGLSANSSYDDSGTGLKYVSDEQYIDTGNYSQIASTYVTNNLAKEYFTVRYFPTGTRNCYTIRSLNAGIKYLVRATFYYGNYDKLNTPPIFDIYLGVNFWDTVNSNLEYYYEIMVEVSADYLEVCLVNVGNGNPFISSLYLRPLKGTYSFVNSTQSLVLMKRLNIGAGNQQLVRYLANNNLSGSLPSSLDNLTALKLLDLRGNPKLSTTLPHELLKKQQNGSLEYRFGDNMISSPPPSKKNVNIITIAMGVPLLVIAVAIATVFWLKRRKYKQSGAPKEYESSESSPLQNDHAKYYANISQGENPNVKPQSKGTEQIFLNFENRKFSYNDMKKITSGFKNNMLEPYCYTKTI